MNAADQQAYDIVKKLFKNDNGDPFEMTPGQIGLFRAIYERQHPRTQFDCYTQYGKSDIVSMASLLRATTFPEKWIVLGGSKAKAEIIMQKVIKHLFENDYCLSKFEIDEKDSLERIRRQRSKDRITFKIDEDGNVGEVVILSADTRRKDKDAGDILIGHGGKNLIIDDAALVPDGIFGKALRMLGGHIDNFLLKITNSFGRNHAYRSSIDPKYKKIKITWEQGLAEGRVNQEFIDEMRVTLDPIMFGILYDCEYPPADMIDEKGWTPLLTEEEVREAMSRTVEPIGAKRLGADIGEGINPNAFVTRQDNFMSIKELNQERDLMKTADRTKEIMVEERVLPGRVFMDAVGVGAGVVARVIQMGLKIVGVKAGEMSSVEALKKANKAAYEKLIKLNPIEFKNLKAEMYWLLREWIRQGGALSNDDRWISLCKIRYRTADDKKIQIMSKIEMRADGLLAPSESTDVPDAAALTFAPEKKKVKHGKASELGKPHYPSIGI